MLGDDGVGCLDSHELNNLESKAIRAYAFGGGNGESVGALEQKPLGNIHLGPAEGCNRSTVDAICNTLGPSALLHGTSDITRIKQKPLFIPYILLQGLMYSLGDFEIDNRHTHTMLDLDAFDDGCQCILQ